MNSIPTNQKNKPFILEYKTVIDNTNVLLPLKKGGDYDFTVDWGDGKKNRVTTENAKKSQYHTYKKPGSYKIVMQGKIEGLDFFPPQRRIFVQDTAFIKIKQWGAASFGKDGSYIFHGAKNITLAADDAPDLSKTETLENAFARSQINFEKGINHWDTSNVKDMTCMFYGCEKFNQPIGNWNTSKVQIMDSMFSGCREFNQPIGNWDTSKVQIMDSMFSGCREFNQPIGNWDTSNVKDMNYMFSGCREFDQPIGNWDTSNVRDMTHMFSSCKKFNQPIGNWDTSNVQRMFYMFDNCKEFKQSLENWSTDSIEKTMKMFRGCEESALIPTWYKEHDFKQKKFNLAML